MDVEFQTIANSSDSPHRQTWAIAKRESQRARQLRLAMNHDGDVFEHKLVAIAFAMFSFEGFLHYVGRKLDPAVWQDEQKFFKREPYRGFHGRLKWVIERCELSPNPDWEQAVEALKIARDDLAHPKAVDRKATIIHPEPTLPPPPTGEPWRQRVDALDLDAALIFLEQYVRAIDNAARAKFPDAAPDYLDVLESSSLFSTRTTEPVKS